MIRIVLFCIFISLVTSISGQYRPDIFFREDWKEIPAEIPVSQKHIANPDIVLTLYGPGKDSLKKSNHEKPVDDPYYLWSGLCTGNWAVTFSHPSLLVDLSSFAKIRWRTKQAGFRALRVILKLNDGTWLVSDVSTGPSADWNVREIILDDVTWRKLNIERIYEGGIVEDPDLSRVKEIGCTDLMPGGMSGACSRLDWIEVYGFPVEP